MDLIRISRDLAKNVDTLRFAKPVTHVYNPLRYARRSHEQYLTRFGTGNGRVLFIGMNPGPWGMVQTGVPFGDVDLVRDWMGIEARVGQPGAQHPKRPVEGFNCSRNEVSGTRLWGWARDRFGTPERFFKHCFVWNYCPLAFMEESGRNRTPDKLPKHEQEPLFDFCDTALRRMVETLEPRIVIGVGAFGERRAKMALAKQDIPTGRILHPSPASPAANRGWAEAAETDLAKYGIRFPEAG